MTPDNHNGVTTHLEPDILEYEVKWALGSINGNKTSGGDGIPAELFKILNDDAIKVSANLENSAVATELEKVSFLSNPKCQKMFKLLLSFHMLVRLSSKSFKLGSSST